MNSILLTILGFSVIFIATTLGAATVFFFRKDISKRLNSVLLGFAAGIMTAASVWSLLIPSIEGAVSYGKLSFLPAVSGLCLGGIFLIILDKFALSAKNKTGENRTLCGKNFKLFVAMTVHNIPEGLAVGFAFGAAKLVGGDEAFISALGLSIGIAIQNFPEGAAVSLPLKKNAGRVKSFLFGAGSGAVEPIAAVIGYYLASFLSVMQPWFLSFAAGAMLFVVAEDLIPDAVSESQWHLGTWGFIIGFAVMMALDVALG